MKLIHILSIIIFLCFLGFSHFIPSIIYADIAPGNCECGKNPFGECNVNCTTTCVGVVDSEHCKTTWNDCNGPNDCPGGACSGGTCGGTTNVCQYKSGSRETCVTDPNDPSNKACGCCYPATEELQKTSTTWVANCGRDLNCEKIDNKDPCGPYALETGVERNIRYNACRGWCRDTQCANYACVKLCKATDPFNLSATNITTTRAKINWKFGSYGQSQRIRIGTNKAKVEADCPNGVGGNSGCAIKVNNLASNIVSYTTANILTPATTYYARVINFDTSSCEAESPTLTFTTATPPTTCTSVSISAVASPFIAGTQAGISSTVNGIQYGPITDVVYSSSATNIVTVPSNAYTTAAYNTTLSGISAGTSTITAIARKNGEEVCRGTRPVTVTAANSTAWWQVKDGDVTTNESIISVVPTIVPVKYFNIVGSGGFAGIPVFGGTFNLTGAESDKISVPKWNVNTNTSDSKLFNYSYFKNLVPSDVVSGQTYTDGYKYTIITGDYTLPSTDVGTNKEIYFINGNLTINGNVNVTDGQGFFMAIVSGNINVSPAISGSPALEGIYLADGSFSTGPGTTQLHVRGSVASYGGITLERSLVDNSNSAELFEFAPDQILLFPPKLGFRGQRWTEVAP